MNSLRHKPPLCPRPFDPRHLSGLYLWLRAERGLWQDTAASIPAGADGDPVARWDDQSGMGHHATQGSASARAVLKVDVQNSRPILRFDGSDDVFEFDAVSLLAWSVFAVVRNNDALAGSMVVSRQGSSTQYFGIESGGNPDVCSMTPTTSATANLGKENGFNLLYGEGTGAQIRAGVNGILGAAVDSTALWLPDRIGYYFTSTFLLDGDLGEVLLYQRRLTVTERQGVERYLLAHWGVSG